MKLMNNSHKLVRNIRSKFSNISAMPVLLLIMFASVLVTYAQKSRAEILKEAADVRKQKIEAYIKPYSSLYEGNKRDRELNLKKVDYYKKKLDKEDNHKSKKYRIYKKLSKLYSELTKINESVVQKLEKRNVRKAYENAEKVLEIERKVESITKKNSSRTWLTLSEMESYTKKKYKYKTSDPFILPLLKSDWRIPKQRKALSREKPNKKS